MKCHECECILDSKWVREFKKLTYAVHESKWHDCIDGQGSGKANYKLDNSNEIVKGYCGCKGWP